MRMCTSAVTLWPAQSTLNMLSVHVAMVDFHETCVFCPYYAGQFWNTPVTAVRYNGTLDRSGGNLDPDRLYVVTVTPQDGAPPRSFLAESYVRTWENFPIPCLYAGNSQAGWSGEVDALRDPVIQGRYRDYIVNGLFETDFLYDKFDESGNCPLA